MKIMIEYWVANIETLRSTDVDQQEMREQEDVFWESGYMFSHRAYEACFRVSAAIHLKHRLKGRLTMPANPGDKFSSSGVKK
ncbi:hypothetical protein TNCV_5124451 [Trichonephila clavipes]|nr:hypothetical protein TNCV_5124451 [Trichonephila clavipes]